MHSSERKSASIKVDALTWRETLRCTITRCIDWTMTSQLQVSKSRFYKRGQALSSKMLSIYVSRETKRKRCQEALPTRMRSSRKSSSGIAPSSWRLKVTATLLQLQFSAYNHSSTVRWMTATCLAQQRMRWSVFTRNSKRRSFAWKRAEMTSTSNSSPPKRISTSWLTSKRCCLRNSRWSKMNYSRVKEKSCLWRGKSWSSTM